MPVAEPASHASDACPETSNSPPVSVWLGAEGVPSDAIPEHWMGPENENSLSAGTAVTGFVNVTSPFTLQVPACTEDACPAPGMKASAPTMAAATTDLFIGSPSLAWALSLG